MPRYVVTSWVQHVNSIELLDEAPTIASTLLYSCPNATINSVCGLLRAKSHHPHTTQETNQKPSIEGGTPRRGAQSTPSPIHQPEKSDNTHIHAVEGTNQPTDRIGRQDQAINFNKPPSRILVNG